MDGSPFVAVARVVKSHGLAGEMAVMPLADGPFELEPGTPVWFVPPPDGVRCGAVESVRSGPKGPLLKVSGVDDPTAARDLVGRTVLAAAADVPAIAERAAAFDPLGCTVTDEARGDLGTIDEVIVTGANDVWVVHGRLGEVLLPVIDDVVLEVDTGERRVRVRLLPGLLSDEEDAV